MAALAKLKFTTSLADLSDRQLVIEAVIEDEAVKRKIFAEARPAHHRSRRGAGVEHVSIPTTKLAARHRESGTSSRAALLQPGTRAAAGRTGQHTRHQ